MELTRTSDVKRRPLPLAGVRVLDLTHVGAGPFCTSLLGQLGADVIKVERPGQGELMRAARPRIGDGEVSYYFASVNVQKRYAQIDLRSKAGQAVIRRLIRGSDVLVQNFSSGTAKRLGADPELAKRLNRRLVYCSIVGFREGSKYSGLPSFDYIHEAMSGVMAMTGYAGQPPPLPGFPAADMSAALYATLAIVLALRMREHTGRGDHLEVALQDSLVSLLPLRLGFTFATGQPYPPFGRYHQDFAPFGVLETKDSLLVITVGSQELWEDVVKVLPDLDQEMFATLPLRIQHKQELYEILTSILRTRTTAEWVAVFRAAGVPAAPVMSTAEVAEDSYTREITRTLKMTGGEYKWIPYPVRHDGFSPVMDRPPGVAGTDTAEILDEIGYSSKDIERLRRLGIVAGF